MTANTMSSAPTTLQFEELPDEESYPINSDAAAFMASFAQSASDLSSDEERDDSPVQVMGHMVVMATSPQRQTKNERRKIQRKKAHTPPLIPTHYPRPISKSAEQKHPFWQLLSPDEYLKLIGG